MPRKSLTAKIFDRENLCRENLCETKIETLNRGEQLFSGKKHERLLDIFSRGNRSPGGVAQWTSHPPQ
jgi:hypothetical protein